MVVDYTRAVIITNLHVPFSATHEASLDCKYDLEGDQLYDVKWYKDGQHFFRCQPNGQVQEFQLDGIKIYPTNFATIGSCPLTLIGLNFKSGGEYKCEVTTEGPSFKAIAKSAKMKILQLSRRVQEPTVEKTNESTDNLINSLSNASKTSSPTTSIRKGTLNLRLEEVEETKRSFVLIWQYYFCYRV